MSQPPLKQKKQNFTSFCLGLFLGSLTTTAMLYDRRPHKHRPFPALLPTKRNLKLGALTVFFWSGGIVLGLLSIRHKRRLLPRDQKDPVLMNRPSEQTEAWRRLREAEGK